MENRRFGFHHDSLQIPMPKKNPYRKKRSSSQTHRGRTVLKYLFLAVLLTGTACFLLVYSVYAGLWGRLPDYQELRHIRNDEASELYSEDGELLGKYYIENRTNIGFDHISPYAVQALIATEDVRFYQHEGIDKISMLRVIFKTFLLQRRSSGGGSTLSQQLAKNLYPREEQQVTFIPIVKLKEMFTAHRLENLYTKDEILTLYLNTVFFGENTFGIESAARKYFSTSASGLDLPQAATLIGMLKGPSYYNPRLYPERALQRRNTVINQMVKYSYLDPEEGKAYKSQPLKLAHKPDSHYAGMAPHLREKIRRDAVKILEEYNALYGTRYNLYRDGLTLTTTVDAEMQYYAEEAVNSHMKKLQDIYYRHLGRQEPWDGHPEMLEKAIRNSTVYKRLKHQGKSEKEIAKLMEEKKPMLVYSPYQGETRVEYSSIDSLKHYLKILHPAMLAVEPQTGKIKVWIGDLDYKYFQYDQVEASRQVGSVFKPIVYSAAISHGARLDAYYKNEQKSYPEYGNWSPRNADNRYEGYYTLKGALSRSINTIAVEVALQTGLDTVIAQAHRLGIETELPPYPSLALGVADIPLLQMIRPFLCFANNGIRNHPYYLLEIKDKKGHVIFKAPESKGTPVLRPTEAHLMNQMLAAVIDEGTGRRLRSAYGLTNEMAGKTGTTQNQADGWFIGYNPRIVAGIRIGANDMNIHFNSTALGQGAHTALPIFGLFMQRCLKSHTYAYWNNLSFPLVTMPWKQNVKVPEYKDHLNLIDKLTNRKLDKTPPMEKPKKEHFFQRLFRRKEKR